MRNTGDAIATLHIAGGRVEPSRRPSRCEKSSKTNAKPLIEKSETPLAWLRACPAFGEGTPQRDGCIDTDHKRQGIVMTCLAAMRHHHGRESTLTRPGHPDQRYHAAVPLRIPQTARYLIDPYHVRLTLGRGPVPGMEGVEEQTVDSSNSSNSRQLRQQPWGSRACWSDPR